jgi:hypothetical protein
MLPSNGMASSVPTLKRIAFGMTKGRVFIFDLSSMTLNKMDTKLIPRSHTIDIAFFSSCNKVVYFVWLEDKCVVEENCSHEVGVLDLNSEKVVYWDTSQIGLGKRILEEMYLSSTNPNLVYGFFADKYDYEVVASELDSYKKSIKTGAFNVCKETWQQVAAPSEKETKIFTGQFDHPLFKNQKSKIRQYLKAANLISEKEHDRIIWADDNYVLFTSYRISRKNLVIGHIAAGHVIIDKTIDTEKYNVDGSLLNPDSAVFIYE